jgi:lactoylglutathione lyase
MRFHHIGLETANLEKAISFYTERFGYTVEKQFHFMNEEIVFLVLGNTMLELISNQEENNTAHICYEVNTLEDVMKQLDPKKLIEGPYFLENGWKSVFYEGPNQEMIEFLQIRTEIQTIS